MKGSILCNTFLAGFFSCQKLNVFTTVETIHVISTQGQTEPPTTRTVSSSIITSEVFLSSVEPRHSRFPEHGSDDRWTQYLSNKAYAATISSDEPKYSRFPDRNGNHRWTQYLPSKVSVTSKSSARSTSTSKSSTSTKTSSRSSVTSAKALTSSSSTLSTQASSAALALPSTTKVAVPTLATTQSPTSLSTTQTSSSKSTSSSRSSSSSIISSSSSSSSSSSKVSSSSSSATSISGNPPSATGPSLPVLPPPVDYISTGLYYHNMHRLNHTAPLIVWNPAQAAIAAEIASSCVFAHNMTVGGGGYGQNLAAYGATGAVASLSPSSMLAKSITNQWYYGEVANFLPSYYGQPTPDMTNFEAWGHFTQVVWKGSLTVGCASQLCPAGTIFPAPYESWFTVCNYVPPGNYIGQFGLNVSPPIGLPSIGPV